MEKGNKKLITHNGSFHTDDIFAAATLAIFLEKKGDTFEIFRTRDEAIIKNGDYVFDVGGVYDEKKNRFDHHQIGGAGRRIPAVEGEAGIEYASFGLVWKKFGLKLSGSEKAFEMIDKKLAAPIDAGDNGFDLVENKYEVTPYVIQQAFSSMKPTWREENVSIDEMFLKCVDIAKQILSREIIQASDGVLAEEKVFSIYDGTEDKRIIILDNKYPFEHTLHNFPEPLFVVYPRGAGDNAEEGEESETWGVKAVRADPKTFKNRKNFPKHWAGLRDEDLQNVTNVRDAIFCHRGLFLSVAKSKEGAIKLAQIAVES